MTETKYFKFINCGICILTKYLESKLLLFILLPNNYNTNINLILYYSIIFLGDFIFFF